MKIKRRHLAPSLEQWIMSTLQLGPGVGDIFFVAEASSQYESWAKYQGVDSDHLFDTLAEAEDACVASRNDVVCVYPGTYTQTAKITWDKSSTHLIGLGSPNQRIPATAGTAGCVYFPCTTAMTELFLISGHHCQFHNFSTYLSTATGVADVRVQGRNTLLKGLFMKSGQNATQLASDILGYSLYLDNSAAGYCNGFTAEGCHIGDPRNTVRTAGGMIYMTGVTNAGMCYEFKDCFISGWSETNACSAVFVTGNNACDRYVLWQDCTFYNFYTNLGSILTGDVFTDTCGTTHMHLLTGRTCQYGWDEWGSGTYIFGSMPVPYATGGTMVTMT